MSQPFSFLRNIVPDFFNPSPRKSRGWWVVLGLSFVIGFWIRAEFVVHGYESLNSDEITVCRSVLAQSKSPESHDFIPPTNFFRHPAYLTCRMYAFLADGKITALPFLFCAASLLIYLAWALVLNQKTEGNWNAAFPMLLLMAIPAPCLSYLGIQLSEIRSFYFYGALLVLFAGQWFRNDFSIFAFGFLSVRGLLDDPFVAFFLWPVLVYEFFFKKTFFPFKSRRNWGAAVLGGLLGGWLNVDHHPWFDKANSSYLHLGLAPPSDWVYHAKMVLQTWPLYWVSVLPYDFFQQSPLGLSLHPPPPPWVSFWVPLIFWVLFLATAVGSFLSLRKPRWAEAILWGGPFLSFLVFFIFGSQSADALTLRYLGFGQLVPALGLGLWAAHSSVVKGWSGKLWVILLSLWMVFNAIFLIANLRGPARQHPGAHIAVCLEQAGIRAGFANYWVSETVRYFSRNQILIAAYNRTPLSREAIAAAQNSREIGLIWVEGLDGPQALFEVEGQLRGLSYRLDHRVDFNQEGWSVFVWRKTRPNP